MCYWCVFTHVLLCFIVIVVAVFTVFAADGGCVWGCSCVCDVRFDFYWSLCCHLMQKSFKHKVINSNRNCSLMMVWFYWNLSDLSPRLHLNSPCSRLSRQRLLLQCSATSDAMNVIKSSFYVFLIFLASSLKASQRKQISGSFLPS